MRVRTHSDMLQWLKYFLVGVEQTATEAVGALTGIIKLKTDTEALIHNSFGRRAATATLLLEQLFKQPILSVDQAATICGVNYRPANELIALMCEHKILREITGQSRNRLFAFEPYMELFNLK